MDGDSKQDSEVRIEARRAATEIFCWQVGENANMWARVRVNVRAYVQRVFVCFRVQAPEIHNSSSVADRQLLKM